jgi:hypothetical protein
MIGCEGSNKLVSARIRVDGGWFEGMTELARVTLTVLGSVYSWSYRPADELPGESAGNSRRVGACARTTGPKTVLRDAWSATPHCFRASSIQAGQMCRRYLQL